MEFKEILNRMEETHTQKNHDYGNSFDKSLDADGLLVAKIRLGDKYNRFSSLLKKEAEVKDESIKDTLLDLANYAAMTLRWMEENEDKDKLNKRDLFLNEDNLTCYLTGERCSNNYESFNPTCIKCKNIQESLNK